MKTYKNLYPRICRFNNLYWAFLAARKGKRDRAAVAAFEFDLEHNLITLSFPSLAVAGFLTVPPELLALNVNVRW